MAATSIERYIKKEKHNDFLTIQRLRIFAYPARSKHAIPADHSHAHDSYGLHASLSTAGVFADRKDK
ncbi:hypothetical protein ABHI18_002781 [Aspergillus niger]